MTQSVFARRRSALRVTSLLLAASLLALVPAVVASPARAQALGYASAQSGAFPEDQIANDPAAQDEDSALPDRFRRTIVSFDTREAPGTVIIDTGNTYLYYVLGNGRAIRYGVGVGREGFTWAGTQTVSHKAEWPDWHPPAEMIERQPYLPRFMAGGPGNPLGARAMYLGSSEYRIHGTNDPSTIGKFVSSGCIRLTNEDVSDLFNRVNVGTRVVVLPKSAPLRSGTVQARGGSSARPLLTRLPIGTAGDDAAGFGCELNWCRRRVVAVRSLMGVALGAAAMVGALALPHAAQAEDFLSALFGGFNAPRQQTPQPYIRAPFADEGAPVRHRARRSEVSYGDSGEQAWCVRTCDGRYFPLASGGDQSGAVLCNNFCPASKTEVVYGSNIDDAATEGGKSYSELPNAFKYRTELVDGCTCNGKDHFGLAKVSIENDPDRAQGRYRRQRRRADGRQPQRRQARRAQLLAGAGIAAREIPARSCHGLRMSRRRIRRRGSWPGSR